MEITLRVPEALGKELQNHQDKLVEILERGLQDLKADPPLIYQDENKILELLASQPTPQQILSIKPSKKLQTRVSELLSKSKENQLTTKEEAELERYLTLEHLVRLAKAHALKNISHKQS